MTLSLLNIVNQSAFPIEMITNRLDMEPADNVGKNLGRFGFFKGIQLITAQGKPIIGKDNAKLRMKLYKIIQWRILDNMAQMYILALISNTV